MEFYKLWKMKGGWMEIKISDGLMGYIPSRTRVSFLKHVLLKDDSVDVFDSPSSGGRSLGKLVKGDQFFILPKVPAADKAWERMRYKSGQQGYIPGPTKIRYMTSSTVPSVATAGHDIGVGALWCIGGIAVTAGTYAAVANTGGTYFIAWGAMLFGGLQFLKGIFRAIVAKKPVIYGHGGEKAGQSG